MNKDGIAIESGSNLTIKDGSGGNVINMDNTGMTLSSTGQLKLQSADSIIIGGSPFGVGGTNILKNTQHIQGIGEWSIGSVDNNSKLGTHYPDPFGGTALKIYDVASSTWCYNDSLLTHPLVSGE
jgi:hypothetical protein